MTVAQTILAQIGGNRFIVMTGATGFVSTEDSLSFQFPRNTPKNKIKYIKIILKGDDTYTVKFYQYNAKKFEVKEILESAGLYVGELKSKIELETGVYLSL
jgi:hypothetical protein